MKNLTRVLTLLVVFSMVLGSVAFAADAKFSDVEEGTILNEATTVLSDLGIFMGYEDGTFGGDKVITRAEVVAVANRLQGLSNAAKAAGGATAYTDVPADEWYAGDVNLATQMGIISGDGNGLFRPNDSVKYEEAVKIIVASLGYTQNYVMEKGGWPTGYLVIASEAKVSDGLSVSAGEPAYRNIVARLSYNALTAPMMVLSSYASDGTSVYAPNKDKILLDEKLATYKLTGDVTCNSVSSLTSATTTLDTDEVTFDIKEKKVGSVVTEFGLGDTPKLLTGKTEVANYLGFRGDAYVQKNDDGDYEVVCYVPLPKKNNKTVIENTGDVVAVGATKYPSVIGATTANKLSVFDADNDSTNTEYDLDDDAVILYNGKYYSRVSAAAALSNIDAMSGAVTTLGTYYAPNSGEITLLDSGNDGTYDYMFVKSYETLIVDEVYSNNEKISCKDGNTVIDLSNADKKGYTYNITLDGAAITAADLVENDVLSVSSTSDKKNIDILVSRNVVSGGIEELDPTENKYVVSGTEYEVANVAAFRDTKLTGVAAGDEGDFYLDSFGKIAKFEKTSATSKNYGFVVATGDYTSAGEKSYEVKLLDKDGVMNTYTLKDTVKFTDVAGTTTNSAKDLVVYNALKALNSTVYYDATGTAVDTWVLTDDLYTDNTHSPASKVTAAALRNAMAQRLVTFKLNSSDEITEVTMALSSNDKDKFSFYGVASSKYKSSTTSFGSVGVTDETVVFLIPTSAGTTRDDYAVSTIAGLSDDESYDVAFYTVDDDLNASAIVVTSDNAEVSDNTTLAVITKLMKTTDSSSNDIYNVTFMQNGETKTLATSSDAKSYFDSAVKGDIFEYAVDGSGNIDKVNFAKKGDHHGMTTVSGTISAATIAAKIAAGTLSASTLGVPYYEYSSDGAKAQYVFGEVVAKTASSKLIQIAPVAVNGANPGTGTVARHVIPDSANIIKVDLTKASTSSSYVVDGAFTDLQVAYYNPSTDLVAPNAIDADRDTCVLIKYYNDVITDVIVFNGFITKYFNAGV